MDNEKTEIVMATVAAEGGQRIHAGVSPYVPLPEDMAGINSPAILSGTDFHQMLQISLAPGDLITAEPGSLVMMSGELKSQVELGSCTDFWKRACCAGQSGALLLFENKTDAPQFLCLAPPKLGKLIPLPLEKWSGITVSSGVFVAAYGRKWRYELTTAATVGTACCGGQGLIMTKILGEGTAFITGSGAVEMVELKEGEQIVVDQANLLAFSNGVQLRVRLAGGCLVCCCGGMGMFNSVLTGPGTVFVESLPMSKLAHSLRIHGAGGSGGGEE